MLLPRQHFFRGISARGPPQPCRIAFCGCEKKVVDRELGPPGGFMTGNSFSGDLAELVGRRRPKS